jgi:glycine cleavage system H protein
MTVLIVLAFFATFIALDWWIDARRHAREAALRNAQPAAPAEPTWVAGYQLPESLHYHRGHTWARLAEDGTVAVGLDDFARRLVGPAEGVSLPAVGDWLEQGGRGFAVKLDGRSAGFVSPVEGEVLEVNTELKQKPALATADPYGRGWVLRIKPTHLAEGLRNLLSGRLARRWMEDSREALDLRLMALSGSVLQDGGEPVADFARHLSETEWKRLVGEFLLT